MGAVNKTVIIIISIIIINYKYSRCVHKNYSFCHHKCLRVNPTFGVRGRLLASFR